MTDQPYHVRYGYHHIRCAEFQTFAEALLYYKGKAAEELRRLKSSPSVSMDLPAVYGENHDDERDGLTDDERDAVNDAFADAMEEIGGLL